MKRIVIASGNAGKLKEFAALFAPLGVEPVPQSMLGIAEPEEPHGTFVENALAKARHASSASGLPAMADDSGICALALGGAPGVFSARYAGEPRSDARNNAKLIAELAHHADRRAFYYCALVLVRHSADPIPLIAEAEWAGDIVSEASGDGGFGYDPHFFLPAFGCTAAQLPAETKNRVSHRGKALQLLAAKLPAWAAA
ncbi:MAG: RdgB/HAM1 family non-canonical purine NTP pyrophosphatase [Betaproteobacteria bacterium]|nr:RdgB/HAM1 family non-canonical purine NTP pyrophosphatase [Betaproteobacteria bacterium]